jgi:hypothetical protein
VQSSVEPLLTGAAPTTRGGWNRIWCVLPESHRSALVDLLRNPSTSPFLTLMLTLNDWIVMGSSNPLLT